MRLSNAGKVFGVSILMFIWVSTLAADFEDASQVLGFSGDGKAAFGDFNVDGWVDIYAGGKLYRNEAGRRFVHVENSNLPGGEGIWGDFDNDGFPDLFVFTGKGSLHRNLGNALFQQVSFPELPTINSRGAVWMDINNDGWLDLYVGGYEIWEQQVHPDAIYLNQRDGTFAERWRSSVDAHYSARGVTAADFDEDGSIDIYVSNYRLQPNHLWKNDGEGKFVEVASQVGAAGIPDEVITYTGGIGYPICGHTIGSACGDLDDDGHIDIFVGNFSHPPLNQDRPQFLRNLITDNNLESGRQLKFEDRSEGAGLDWQESFASAALGDYDNDGDLDLFFTTVYATASKGIKNFPVLYRNQGNWRFVNVTDAEHIPQLGPTYQAAWADIDNDGDLDLCTNGKLFVNRSAPKNWIKLQLIGDGKRVNRSAVGATARIQLGDRVLTRHLETGTGEGNQNDMRLHFGLGTHADLVDLAIVWPGGAVQQVSGLAVNQIHRVEFNK